MFTNVSEEFAASIFRAFFAEDGDSRFFQNVGNDILDCTASRP
jgi:hypothetical protein